MANDWEMKRPHIKLRTCCGGGGATRKMKRLFVLLGCMVFFVLFVHSQCEPATCSRQDIVGSILRPFCCHGYKLMMTETKLDAKGSHKVKGTESKLDANGMKLDEKILHSNDLPNPQVISPAHIRPEKIAEQGNDSAKGDVIPEKKIILFWTSFFGSWDYTFGHGNEPFLKYNCSETRCITTKDKQLVTRANAVVFHARNINGDTHFPETRFPNQSYVFYLQENPFHQWLNLKNYNGLFNLTMTYARDADVPIPYGEVFPGGSHTLTEGQLGALVAGKSKLVAWFVSNCKTQSKRERYVNELKKHIQVDVYGKCGNLTCSTNADKDKGDCYAMLERKYKFYLSFENAFCTDYVTEKTYNVLGRYVVPVVYGGANYTALTPPHSVINVQEFASPKHLAEFLHQLAKDDARYVEYFQWKTRHGVISEVDVRRQGFCRLCERLHRPEQGQQVHTDLHTWWSKEGACDHKIADKLLTGNGGL